MQLKPTSGFKNRLKTLSVAFVIALSTGAWSSAQSVSFDFDIENFGGSAGNVFDQSFMLNNVVSIDSVSIELSHSFASDIDFTMLAPDGQTFNFTSDLGGGRDLGDGGSLLAGTSIYTFVEFASEDLGQASGDPIPGGTYRALEWGVGAWEPGNWRLVLDDDAGDDLGAVGSVSVGYTIPAIPEPSAIWLLAISVSIASISRRRSIS